MCKNFGCLRSWRYYKSCPEISLWTGISRLWRNWAGYCRLFTWAGVMALTMEVVCDLVRWAIGPGSVALSTFVHGESTVCVTLDLVHCKMGSYFPGLMAPLDMTGLR